MTVLWLLLLSIPPAAAAVPSLRTAVVNFFTSNPLPNLSPQCNKDMVQFISGLDKVSRVAEKYLDGSIGPSDFQVITDNLFAAKQFDAFGKMPSGLSQLTHSGFGSYETCAEVDGLKYETDFCHVFIYLQSNVNCSFASHPSNYKLSRTKLSVCMPKSCSRHEITSIYRSAVSNLPATVCETHCVKREHQRDSGRNDVFFFFWTVTSFFVAIFSLSIYATLLESRNEHVNETPCEWTQFILCFSLISNFRRILCVQQPETENHIKGLDFLRAANAFWVVTGHSVMTMFRSDSLKSFVAFRQNFFERLVLHGEFSVDAFFFIFGVTLALVFLKQRLSAKEIRSPFTWVGYVVNRYFRLIPPMITWVMVFTVYGEHLIGPMDSFAGGELRMDIEICKKHWWKLLYFKQGDGFLPEMCYPSTWYIAADFRIYLMVALVLAVMNTSIRKGLFLMAAMGSLSIVWTFHIYSLIDFTNYFKYTLVIHMSAVARLPIVFIGMITGYILLDKTLWAPFFDRKRLVAVGWLASSLMGTYVFMGNWNYDQGAKWTHIDGATFFVVSRICWSLFLSWVVLTCNFNLCNPMAPLMRLPIWRPFGRLAYCVYLIHTTVIHGFVNLSDRPMYACSMIHLIVSIAIPIFVVSMLIALFWSAIFEVGVSRLVQLSLGKVTNGQRRSAKKD